MVVEIAVSLIAAAIVVLAAFLIPTLIQIRKAVAECERLLAQLNNEVPPLMKDVRILTEEARDGVEHASVLLHAVGEIGETVQHVNDAVRGQTDHLLKNLASMVVGLKAATTVVRQRKTKEGGDSHGG